MRIAIIGAGRIGAGHAAVIAAQESVTQVVVADAHQPTAERVAAEIGGVAAASVDAVFAAGAVDAVAIATATPTHAELILAGVRAGLPTFCEKPVALDAATTLAVGRQVDELGGTVQIGFQRRFDAGYRAAQAAIADGSLGGLRRVHLVSCDPAPPHASFFPTSGGMFRDLCIHDLDVVRFVTGREVAEVYATGANRGDEFIREAGDIDECTALMTLDDGTLVTLHGSRYNGAGYDIRMEVAGTKATMVVGLEDRVPLRSAEPGVEFPTGTPFTGFRDRFGPSYVAEVEAFVALVNGEGTNPCTINDALQASYIADALDLSWREHRPVKLAEVLLP